MSEVKSVLEVIKSITSNRESGRLEISSTGTHGAGPHGSGTHGVLLFVEGKLVDARLESLSGFQAVNAAFSLRDVEFSFDHVVPAPQVVSITPSERVVLQRFFGIEAAEIEPSELAETEAGWNESPEQVVPLIDVEELPQTARRFAFLMRPQVAAVLVLLLAVIAGAITLRSRIRARQQATSTASVVATETTSVPEAPREVAQAPNESPAVAVSEPQDEVHDLNGVWRVVNTVEKTDYKSFHNMQLGFRLNINQNGKEFTAKGEKFSENGQTLPAGSRTPIQVTGSIEGDKVVATFVEDGRLRRSNGRFVWTLQGDDRLNGTFVSTAGNNRGRSAVTKEQ